MKMWRDLVSPTAGRCFLEIALEEVVDSWHRDERCQVSLSEYLGLSSEEYKLYLEQGFDKLVENIRNGNRQK